MPPNDSEDNEPGCSEPEDRSWDDGPASEQDNRPGDDEDRQYSGNDDE
jgi:hypothetical protein